MRRRHLADALVIGGAALWVAAVFLAPYGAAHGRPWSALIYAAFHTVCHQIAARSFVAFDHPLAVCHRCLGLYVGFLAGAILLPRFARLSEALLASPRWIVAASIPMLVDVVLPFNTAWSRFGTGFLAAFPVSLLVCAAARQLFATSPVEGERYEPG